MLPSSKIASRTSRRQSAWKTSQAARLCQGPAVGTHPLSAVGLLPALRLLTHDRHDLLLARATRVRRAPRAASAPAVYPGDGSAAPACAEVRDSAAPCLFSSRTSRGSERYGCRSHSRYSAGSRCASLPPSAWLRARATHRMTGVAQSSRCRPSAPHLLIRTAARPPPSPQAGHHFASTYSRLCVSTTRIGTCERIQQLQVAKVTAAGLW